MQSGCVRGRREAGCVGCLWTEQCLVAGLPRAGCFGGGEMCLGGQWGCGSARARGGDGGGCRVRGLCMGVCVGASAVMGEFGVA